jgi:hypothetical protein
MIGLRAMLMAACLGALVAGACGAPQPAPTGSGVSGSAETHDTTQSAATSTAEAELIKAFGVKKSTPVDSGFAFFEGVYIAPPYIVERTGANVYINGNLVYRQPGWPIPSRPKTEEPKDPGLPPGLTRESSFDDLAIKGGPPGDSWYVRKKAWILAHFSGEEAVQKALEFWRSLPFVKEASVAKDGSITVETYKGEKVGFVLFQTIRLEPPLQVDDLVKLLEEARARIERVLRGGSCLFLFQNNEEIAVYSKRRVAEELPLAVEILRSARSKAEKQDLLERMGLIPPSNTDGRPNFYDSLISGFKATPDLEKRLQSVVQETGITPFKLEEIPKESPDARIRRQGEELRKRLKAAEAAKATETANP